MAVIEIEIPGDVRVEKEGNKLVIEGDKGRVERDFFHPRISFDVEEGRIVIKGDDKRRKDKAVMYTWEAHINNMITGVMKGYEYKLRIFYVHFPMSVKVESNKVVIKNFLGEKGTREADILEGVEVRVEKEYIIVKGADKYAVGQTAANIEQATKKKGRDVRKFVDGIYIVEKGEASS